MNFEIVVDVLAPNYIEPKQWNATKDMINMALYLNVHEEIVKRSLAFAPCWIVLYFVVDCLAWLGGFQAKITSKVVTCVHSFVVCRLIEYFAVTVGVLPLWRMITNLNTFGDEIVIYAYLSFNVYQIVAFLFWPSFKDSTSVIVLSLVSFTTLVYCLHGFVGGATVVTVVWIIEFPNQFLHFGGILKDMKFRKTKLAVLNKMGYFGSFLALRIGLLAYVLCQIVLGIPNNNVVAGDFFKVVVSLVFSSGLLFISQIIFLIFRS